MDPRIVEFLNSQTVATVCFINEVSLPYCFSCFYAFDDEKALLVFKSSVVSQHGSLLKQDLAVAGTINPDKLNRLAIKGIQFQGEMETCEQVLDKAGKRYYARFPFAVAIPGDIYVINISFLKMTDKSLLSGGKLVWRKESSTEALA